MTRPTYTQITDDLQGRIETGEFSARSQLPTELDLMSQYNASRNTVVDAIKWLIARGFVEARPGQGLFVTARIVPFATTLTGDARIASGGEGRAYSEEVTAKSRKPRTSPPSIRIQPAGDQVGAELRLEVSTLVVSRHQHRFIDDTPWSLQTSFYPMHLVDRRAKRLIEAEDIGEGTVAYLCECLGIEQAGWRDTITVRAAEQAETAFFNLPDDGRVSVIEVRRTAFEDNGSPVRLTVTAYPADRNQFVLNVGKIPPERS
jgi:GntR family transcriptional regulator